MSDREPAAGALDERSCRPEGRQRFRREIDGHEYAKPAGSHFAYFIAAPYSDGREKEGA